MGYRQCALKNFMNLIFKKWWSSMELPSGKINNLYTPLNKFKENNKGWVEY